MEHSCIMFPLLKPARWGGEKTQGPHSVTAQDVPCNKVMGTDRFKTGKPAVVRREDLMTDATVKHHQTASYRGDQSSWLAMLVPWTIPYTGQREPDLHR